MNISALVNFSFINMIPPGELLTSPPAWNGINLNVSVLSSPLCDSRDLSTALIRASG
jgi:hypothetical protein